MAIALRCRPTGKLQLTVNLCLPKSLQFAPQVQTKDNTQERQGKVALAYRYPSVAISLRPSRIKAAIIMMYSAELSMALAHRQRRRASSSARKRALTLTEGATTGSGRSLTTTGSSDATDLEGDAQVPPAVKYLEQVALELSVSKKHADVRYVMTVRHAELAVAWRHARSFDEYRKLQQRLLKKLQHGHFCDADCPWLYGFLKSYFPKKLVFTFSSARVVEQRKQTLERFFAALYGFLTDRKNACCSVVMTVFADELVEFVYGDALQQYGLENPAKSAVLAPDERMALLAKSGGYSSKWEASEKLQLLERGRDRDSDRQQVSSRHSSLTNSCRESVADDDVVNDPNCGSCGLCGSPLCGVAFGSSTSTSSSALSLSPSDEDNSSSSGPGVPPLSRSNSDSGVFAPPWLGTLRTTGSGSANSFGGTRRSSTSASRRRAATYYLTTLSCGHQFHDECIVPKLNESLNCPTCGRVQTNE
ncbi:hypothetical protein PHYPSEUDO_010821 [Phytophthora pseudosyringae]|uniref:PX domain-containing protein n=1 Tax=Phytophthora pseudosyringae TaxID=221518 RepID=A0A8T1WB32_9STRA|nr:hypothetical protein PHYPSEUDO_010821 [Phytophthora pseudosyringae]